jgi:glycosyltransferase involved in cell wall biosynthesis
MVGRARGTPFDRYQTGAGAWLQRHAPPIRLIQIRNRADRSRRIDGIARLAQTIATANMLTRTSFQENPARRHRLSLIVPVYNEEDNIVPLVDGVRAALADAGFDWELIVVDDGSSDRTVANLRAVLDAGDQVDCRVRAIVLCRNFGQTAAMQAGIDAAGGSIIATMDGDLQNNPRDLARMVRRLLDEDLDLLVGWRRQRQDNRWLRTWPSWLANRLISGVTGVRLHDYGCSLKVFRASVLRHIRLYGEMHRFIPTWMATITSPARIREEPVSHFPRRHGKSNYGLSRVFKVVLDLLSMLFFMRYLARPGHLFGHIGLVLGAAGGLILGHLACLKLGYGEHIGDRPLLMLGVLLSLVGVQMVSTGLVMEMLTRTYYEAAGRKPYLVQYVLGGGKGAVPERDGAARHGA